MRAQVLEAFNVEYVLKDVPRPSEPVGHGLLVQVQAASYCHADAVLASGAMWQNLPRIGSHECAGVIVQMGSEVSVTLGLAVGTLIGVPGRAFHPCGSSLLQKRMESCK
ncbi:alcohol dehydrogenase [Fusarium denticulatum]|uniref:Alcohol dehydrogenase n=1 Tax=Fusarium denticulatum TaxID=48507 RepID=A0A8H5WHR5_9HYPO|nr:alcohol dehydrogenase [Fusarium denticulatum]